MIIQNLMEDTEGSAGVYAEHGLSFLVKAGGHRYLIDTGASDFTWDNAEKLGVSVTDVDAVVLSHGHYDHTGGMLSLAEMGYRGPVYLRDNAGLPYYNLKEGERYIGIDPEILKLPGLHLTGKEDILQIDETLSVFSGVTGTRFAPEGNRTLFEKKDGEFIPDTFDHEQYAVLTETGRTVLISGCAHKGILNILERFKDLYWTYPDAIVSGFHMMSGTGYDEAAKAQIRAVAAKIAATGIRFYTGHCTGVAAYMLMKPFLKERLVYLHAGDRVEI